ncbi:RidA family protein [Pseudohalioglobus lutimaris]|jgi:enamine deaminase RidA (YjgF/YER057c/UK114 family)|uniref:RidA family protein n=1 Tax=Pseudohalioglobus lutimaris TaxID=1737061 RepID=A0A2N5X5X0_9GAMM|nr:RidA family protein [Pseudohalioglobus lutimaris]PLW69876.1 RidA family protein [Pseudohalioglobus lutimaris]|tara:strand:+ start:18935 stop:19342 length:408 start_codon:yes stop_codon:yes gene_type:complete
MTKTSAQFFHLIPDMEKSYCMSLAVRAGDLVYIGGLTATDDEGNEIFADDAGMQMKAVYEKMARVLEIHGGSSKDIVSEMIFYGVEATEFEESMFPHRQKFYENTDGPSVAGVQVAGFVSEAIKVEVTAIAYLPQ